MNTEFYDCEDGRCLEEMEGQNSTWPLMNCREGHQGLVCAECLEGWTIQGEFCAECPANSAFTEWPKVCARRRPPP